MRSISMEALTDIVPMIHCLLFFSDVHDVVNVNFYIALSGIHIHIRIIRNKWAWANTSREGV